MVISFKKKFVFIHIPKCAGESITELLLNPLNGGAQFMLKHSTFSDAERILGNDMNNFKIFTVVRNPFEQVVSFYEHLRKPLYMDLSEIEKQYPGSHGRLTPLWASDLAIRLNFNDYVREVYTGANAPKRIMQDGYHWVTTISGKIMNCRILRFEQLTQDFQILADELGLEGELLRRNTSYYGFQAKTFTDYRKYYNQTSRGIIEICHAKGLKEFNYQF